MVEPSVHSEHPTWSLKGYQTEKKPLYNLHLLQAFPKSKVLIVEGGEDSQCRLKNVSPRKNDLPHLVRRGGG